MSSILSGTARDKIDAENREARRLAKLQKDEAEIALPNWIAPEPVQMVMRRVIERRLSSGHKIVFKLLPLETQ